MTREEIKSTPELVDFMLDKCVLADSRIKVRKRLEEICDLAIKTLEQQPNRDMKEQDPCETCWCVEGSPFCLEYCPYDAERMKEQEPTIQDKQAESEKYQKAYINRADKIANGQFDDKLDCARVTKVRCCSNLKKAYITWI